ncbi:MAG: tetratricopeptide repeat protein [Myxococcota bacterium]
MTRRILQLILLLAFALHAPSAAWAQTPPWKGASIIKDPEWQKRFLGSYGFLSGAEPDVDPGELEVLREVIDLMSVNPKAAAQMLAQRSGPDSSAALDFVLANLDFQNGAQDAAIKAYRRALSKFPDFRRAHKNLGLLLVQRSDFKGAQEHLSRAVELGDRDGRNYGLLGYCYLNLENPLAAEEAYRNAILGQPEVRDWKLGLARALLAMDKNKEAVALFGALIDADPDDADIWMLQANAHLGLDQPLAAAVDLEAVRMLGKARPQTLVLLGNIYMNAGMTGQARDAYLEVIRQDAAGTEFETARRAADLLIRTRSWGEAQDILDSVDQRYGKSLDADDQLEVMTLKAKVARAQGREKEAAALLESIVDRDGTRGDALLELARYHQSKGNTAKALLLVERAENVEAFEYSALLEHAQLMVAARDYPEAARLLRRALTIKSEPRVEGFLARVEQAARR